MQAINYKYVVLLIAGFFSALANAGLGSNEWIEEIKLQFINNASAGIGDYQLCEMYSNNENKKDFVERVFQKGATKGMKYIRWKEINLREEAAKSSLHLGIVVIQYTTEEDAKNVTDTVDNNLSNYLAKSLILTQYIALRKNDKVAFIYSETFIDDKIKRLFKELRM